MFVMSWDGINRRIDVEGRLQTPVAAVTVYSAPDDGRKGRSKHVDHTCSC